jgi:hypothetical protein
VLRVQAHADEVGLDLLAHQLVHVAPQEGHVRQTR